MSRTSLDELKSLGRKFDIFRTAAPPVSVLLGNGLVPPLPIWNGELVWGFAIVDATESLGINDLVTTSIDATPTEAVCFALDLEGRIGTYDMPEQSALLDLLDNLDIDATEKAILSRVQLSGSFVPKTRQFDSLTPVVQRLVTNRRVDLKTAVRSRLKDDVWISIADIPGLTVSAVRIIAGDLDEIIRRDKVDSSTVQSIVREAAESTEPQRTIRRRRYPTLTSMEERLVACHDTYLSTMSPMALA